jgi:hypothetical protein
MSDESKPSPSAVEEAVQIHEEVAEKALTDTIDTFLPGDSDSSKESKSEDDSEEEKK